MTSRRQRQQLRRRRRQEERANPRPLQRARARARARARRERSSSSKGRGRRSCQGRSGGCTTCMTVSQHAGGGRGGSRSFLGLAWLTDREREHIHPHDMPYTTTLHYTARLDSIHCLLHSPTPIDPTPNQTPQHAHVRCSRGHGGVLPPQGRALPLRAQRPGHGPGGWARILSGLINWLFCCVGRVDWWTGGLVVLLCWMGGLVH